nr:reverse transcriptase domain-containing protein [Tanacetum cinerariifolium]
MSSPNHPTSDMRMLFPLTFLTIFWLPGLCPSFTEKDFFESSMIHLVMAPKITSTSIAPAMTQAAIRQLVADSVTAALEAQAANMANTNNTNRNPEPRETPAARKCSYKEFMSCQPFNFKGSEGPIGLICWFESIESMYSHSNCTEDCKVKATTGTLTEEALSWWNYFAQPIGIEEAYKITWGNDLKTYVRRLQEWETLCPTSEKMMEAFIEGLPQSIEENFTAFKPQALEEAINIAHRLMDQVTKHNFVQGTNDNKRNFDDRRNTTNNNYHNNHHHQQNKRQETIKAYTATPTENRVYVGPHPLCKRCTLHHLGPCTVRCQTCNNVGHQTRNYKNKGL